MTKILNCDCGRVVRGEHRRCRLGRGLALEDRRRQRHERDEPDGGAGPEFDETLVNTSVQDVVARLLVLTGVA